jgi:hypothetical protein
LQKLKDETDFEFRRAKHQWWMGMRPMLAILARHDSTYTMQKPSLGNLEGNQVSAL